VLPLPSGDDYLAAWLEGEGHFGTHRRDEYPVITASSTDEDIAAHIGQLMGADVSATRHRNNPKWKPFWSITLGGERAKELAKRLYPMMGLRRRRQIDRLLASTWARQRDFGPVLCHPDRKKHARGLCDSCYVTFRRRQRRIKNSTLAA
jgi:hypothetical protein